MGSNPIRCLVVGSITVVAVGCAAVERRGVVVMKVDDTEAHVGLGANEVSVGDRLTLFRYFCDAPKRTTCEKRRIGSGQVTQVLNDSYSVARFRPSINLREGDIVERTSAPH